MLHVFPPLSRVLGPRPWLAKQLEPDEMRARARIVHDLPTSVRASVQPVDDVDFDRPGRIDQLHAVAGNLFHGYPSPRERRKGREGATTGIFFDLDG